MNPLNLSEIWNYRHACKAFDPAKPLPQEALLEILEAGRLSASSFGLEPWKFLVIQNQEMRQRLVPACFNQPQIATCVELIVILIRKNLRPDSPYVLEQFSRWNLPHEALQGILSWYGGYISSMDDRALVDYADKQAHIALANMMTCAASKGIDSCPIDGFDPKKCAQILGIDETLFAPALLLPLGYRAKEPSPKIRLPFDEVVSFIS